MIWTNLDFEYSLRYENSWTAPQAVQHQCTKWSSILRLLDGLQDMPLWSATSGDLSPGTRLVAWGNDQRVYHHARHLELPSYEIVKRINDKRTSCQMNKAFGLELPYEGVIDTVESLQTHLGSCPHDWVLKHPFGVSGRDLRFGTRGYLSLQDTQWVTRQLKSRQGLVFEPRVTIQKEHSLHYHFDHQEVHHLGVCEILTDTDGTHRGHLVDADLNHTAKVQQWRAKVDNILRSIHAQGYRGPLSIDRYEGELEGDKVERHISEINARYTFGRLALELARHVPAKTFRWVHPTRSAPGKCDRLEPITLAWEAQTEHTLWRLPQWADPEGASSTWIEILKSNTKA